MFNLLVKSSKNMMHYRSSTDIARRECLEIKPRILTNSRTIDNRHTDMVDHEGKGQMYSYDNIHTEENEYANPSEIHDKCGREKKEAEEIQNEFVVFSFFDDISIR